MVGGTQGVMVGNLVNDWFKGVAPDWPLGAALVFVLLAIVVVLLAATNRTLRAVSRL
jgi:ABC-type spermidine/putrescine transport system permease subunit I